MDEKDLIAQAGKDLPLATKGPDAGKVLDDSSLSELFGIEMAQTAAMPPPDKTPHEILEPQLKKQPKGTRKKMSRSVGKKPRAILKKRGRPKKGSKSEMG